MGATYKSRINKATSSFDLCCIMEEVRNAFFEKKTIDYKKYEDRILQGVRKRYELDSRSLEEQLKGVDSNIDIIVSMRGAAYSRGNTKLFDRQTYKLGIWTEFRKEIMKAINPDGWVQ